MVGAGRCVTLAFFALLCILASSGVEAQGSVATPGSTAPYILSAEGLSRTEEFATRFRECAVHVERLMDVVARRGQVAHACDTVHAAGRFGNDEWNRQDLPDDPEEQLAYIMSIVEVVPTGGEDAKPDELMRCAILLLGRLHATEAIDLLVENIAFPDDEPATMERGGRVRIAPPRDPIALRSPAAAALAEIGEPCIDRVVEKLTTTDNGREFQCCIAVLQQLSADAVRPKLGAALKHATPEFRARVDAAMKKVAKPTDLREHARRVEELWNASPN
jgi:hypothetical protein